MGVKAHTIQIGSNTWTVNTFGTTKQIEIGKELMKLMGCSLASFLKGNKPQQLTDLSNQDAGDVSWANAVETFIINMKDIDLVVLIKRMVEEALIDNRKVNFETDFSGNEGNRAMKKLIIFILKINYSGFFTDSDSV